MDEVVNWFVRDTSLLLRWVSANGGDAIDDPEGLAHALALKIAVRFIGADGVLDPAEATWLRTLASRTMSSADVPVVDVAVFEGIREASAAFDLGQLVATLGMIDRRRERDWASHFLVVAATFAAQVCAVDGDECEREASELARFRWELLAEVDRSGRGWNPVDVDHATQDLAADVAALSDPATGLPVGPTWVDERAPTPAPAHEQEALEDLLHELDALPGLGPVKDQLRQFAHLVHLQQLRRQAGLTATEQTYHLVFAGNPGTGKTTVARLCGRILRALHVLERGHLVEVSRQDLVSHWVGHTTARTTEVVEGAIGGVLFIDEAYTLSRSAASGSNDFGLEAIETLLKLMEDRRGEFVVIAAGYPQLMQQFLDANPGLRSRFRDVVRFPDYDADELLRIFDHLCETHGYVLATGAVRAAAEAALAPIVGDPVAGNGRAVRALFEAAQARQGMRLVSHPAPGVIELTTFEPSDLLTAAGAATQAPRTAVSAAGYI
jgi:hypothetical protein